MSDDAPLPPKPSQKQFRGRDWIVPPSKSKIRDDAAASPDAGGVTGTLPPPIPGAAPPAESPPAAPPLPCANAASAADAQPTGAAPRSRLQSERELLFQRYAELREKIGPRPKDTTLLVEAAQIAETLSLTIEAMELWRECLRIDPMDTTAPKRLAALDRRAAATGETGVQQNAAYKPREQPPESPPFWTNFGSVLSYPFRGRGLGVFIGASAFFAVGEVLATFNVFFGWFVMLCLLGYLAAWQFDVLSRTAAGRDDPPEFPEVVTIIDSCVLPFLGFLGCAAFAYAPTILLLGLTIQGTLPPGPGITATLISIVPCGFVFPMTLTVRSLTQSIGEAMNPVRVYGSIGRVLPDYLVAFVSLCALWCGWAVARVGILLGVGLVFGLPTADAVLRLDWLRAVGWLVYTASVWPLLLYVWCVQGHLLGCLYRQSYKRLAWFVAPGAEAAQAKRLSVAVALAGLAGCVLLGGGVWVTWAMSTGGGGASSFLSSAAVPAQAGTQLTYFWENTDGPAGTVTYTFTDGGGGKLGIEGSYRHAGDWGVTESHGTVGVLDQRSGTVLRADGEEAGIRLAERAGTHTRFFGPRRGTVNSTYVNEWTVRGDTRFKGTWDAWRVIDPDTSTELYYDKATGVLVGRKFSGVGFTVTEWLTSASSLPSMTRFAPPNRTFEVKGPKRHEDEADPTNFDLPAGGGDDR